MRSLKLYLFTFVAACLLVMTGCVKGFSDFKDTNTDPTKSSNMDPAAELAYTQLFYSGSLSVLEKTTAILLMPMMQQTGGAYFTRYGALYIENKPYMNAMWEQGYESEIKNIVDAKTRSAKDSTRPNLHAMCRVMSVYLFDELTDLYGDLPYFEAAKGFIDGTLHPMFDAQKDIYDDFFKELRAADKEFDPSKDKVSEDLFYGGDVTKWKKFTNSLRIRLALRIAKREPDLAKSEIQDAYNSGVMTSNEDICMTQHEDIQDSYTDLRGNGVSAAFNQQSVVPRVCQTLLDQLKNTADPRFVPMIRVYKDFANQPFNRTDVTEELRPITGIIGVIPGHYIYDDYLNAQTVTLPDGTTVTVSNNEQKAQFANFLIRNNAPFFHMTYAETEFLLADATIRLGLDLGGSADQHYENGVRAACKQLSLFPEGPTISDAQIDDFLAQNPLVKGTELEMINTQLWINLIMNGPEAFANWRRTGYPDLQSAASSESSVTTIPRRFEYPLSEQEQNKENYDAAVAEMGGKDTWTARVWWDME